MGHYGKIENMIPITDEQLKKLTELEFLELIENSVDPDRQGNEAYLVKKRIEFLKMEKKKK